MRRVLSLVLCVAVLLCVPAVTLGANEPQDYDGQVYVMKPPGSELAWNYYSIVPVRASVLRESEVRFWPDETQARAVIAGAKMVNCIGFTQDGQWVFIKWLWPDNAGGLMPYACIRKENVALTLSATVLIPERSDATEPYGSNATTVPAAVGTAVSTANVNVRAGGGKQFDKIGKLKKGQTVNVRSVTGEWAQIWWTWNKLAYVHMDYLEYTPKATQEIAQTDIQAGLPSIDVPSTDSGTLGAAVTTCKVNVRSGPGKAFDKLGRLKKGQTVAVWSIIDGWAEITWDTGSQKAYVYARYLEFE